MSPLSNANSQSSPCARRGRFWAALIAASGLIASACHATQVRYVPVADVVPIAEPLEAVLYLVGDAGIQSPGRDAILAHLEQDLGRVTAANPGVAPVVTFLGDNIYDVGARIAYRDEDFAKLQAQVDALGRRASVRGVFLPGNHDWGKGAGYDRAREAVEIQQGWLEEMSGPGNVGLMPGDACPGPETLDIGQDVHLVFIDTEWLLREPDDDCGGAEAFYERLSRDLGQNRDRRTVIAAHHPMATGGPHGGNVAPFHNGPFVYYLAVKSGLSIQDLASGAYSRVLEGLRSAIVGSGAPPLVFAAGHDHSLQVIRMGGAGEPSYQLVSGSGSKSSRAERIDGTRYASEQHGYMRLDFTRSTTRLVVFAWTPSVGMEVVFSCSLARDDGGCPEAMQTGADR